MCELDGRMSKVTTTQAFLGAALSLAHSLWTRGFRRTLLFSMLGHARPTLGEYAAVNVVKVLRYHTGPKLKAYHPWPLPLAGQRCVQH